MYYLFINVHHLPSSPEGNGRSYLLTILPQLQHG